MVFPKKLMNMFTGDLYSMYVVLQGIGSLPCIRVYIFHSSILKSNSTPSNDDTHVCLCMVLKGRYGLVDKTHPSCVRPGLNTRVQH